MAEGGPSPSIGRTKSFHSTRLREKSEQKQVKKRQLEEVQQEDYEEGQFVAVRWADPPHYWLARVEKDRGAKLEIMWLDPKGKFYVEDAPDTISKITILQRVTMGEIEEGKYTITLSEKKKIQELVKLDDEDGEFVNSDTEDEPEKAVAKIEAEDEDEIPIKEEEDEEFEPEEKEKEKEKKQKGKGKGKGKKDKDSDEESAGETPKKRGRGRPRKKSRGDAESEPTPRKRKAKRKAPESDEEEEEEEVEVTPKKKRTPRKKKAQEDDEEGGGEGPSTPAAKRRKGASPKSPASTRKKKHVSEINPDIPVIEIDPRFYGTDDHLHTNCCTYCTTKEAIRAVLTKNTTLLKNVLNDRTHVYSLSTRRSADVEMNALLYAVRTSNFEAFKAIWEEKRKPTNETPNTAVPPSISLNAQSTGHYTRATYGHAVRAVNVSRGGKEGNNAFTADGNYYQEDELDDEGNNETWVPILLYEVMRNKNMTQEFVLWLITNLDNDDFAEHLSDFVFVAVQEGNRELAIFLVDYLIKRDGWGFNNVHLQALSLNGPDFDKFRSTSVIKKPVGNNAITPVHMAAINPNPKYLKALLSVQPAFDIQDGTERRPVHYAAACSSTAPLQFLISKGIDFMSPDMCGTTPLMIAARLGLLDNINLLLRGYMSRNKLKAIYQNTDFHTKIAEQITKLMGGEVDGKKKAKEPEASKSGSKDDQAQEEDGDKEDGDKEDEGMEDASAGQNGPALPLKEMSREALDSVIHPLEEMLDFADIFANEVPEEEEEPQEADEDGVKLAEAKKVPYVDAVDDNGYSALFYAVESNQPKAVELLIYRNASVELVDGSGKKITPLVLASQLGYLECVKILVEKGKAGVDTPDKLKRTPLIHAAKNGHLPVLSYLLHRGANGNAADTSGNTVTHYAAAFGWAECVKFLIEKAKVEFNAVNTWKLTPFQIALAKSHLACLDILLKQHGIDLNVRGENGCTALAQTCQSFAKGTLPILKFIIEKGADVTIPDANGMTPLHFIASRITPTDTSASEAAELLLAHKADINAQTSQGATPLDVVITQNNWYACKFLLSKGANLSPKEGKNILHDMMGQLLNLDENLMELFTMLSVHPSFEFLAKQTNEQGFTPFLLCVSTYARNDFMQFNQQTGVKERNAATVAQFSTVIDIFLNKLKLDASQSVQQLKKAPNAATDSRPKKGDNDDDEEEDEEDEEEDEEENNTDENGSNKNNEGDNAHAHAHPEYFKYSNDGLKTALHFLATQKDSSVDILKTILSHKHNLNALDIHGKTPLLLAISHKTTLDAEPVSTIINLLLDAGAYVVDKPDPKPYGIDPIFYAQKIHSPLVAALYQDITDDSEKTNETLPVRLLEMGANPKGCADWETLKVHKCFIPYPLLVAIEKNMEKTSQLLIKSGANVNAASREGVPENLLRAEMPSPLHVAIATDHKFVKMLIDAGADVNYYSSENYVEASSFLDNGNYFKDVMTPEAKPENAPVDWKPDPPPPLCHPLVTAVSRGNHESSVSLIAAKSDLYADKGKGPSPIHLAAQHPSILRHILTLKNVDFMAPDNDGDLLLHHVINHTPEEERQTVIEDLVKTKKVDINVPGKDKRTALHYAINNSQAAEDANFDFETFLITMGANINLRDAFNRTPLHYAFVKIGADQFSDKEHADPIEVVTSLCAYKELELDVPDRYGRTPLHYAAQHGALISTLFLLQKGVSLDREDIGGNTPLGIALHNEHPQYALILIREKANVRHPLYLGHFAEVKDANENVISHGDFVVKSKVTMFAEIMKHDWQGIVYLMLYSGFDYLEAMQDAIHAGRFKLALTLLNKTKDDKIVTAQHPTTNRNLMHYLAHSHHKPEHANDAIVLARALQARGVVLDSLDSKNNMPIHYAAKNGFYDLVLLLVNKTRADVLYEPDVTGATPKPIKLAKSPHIPNKDGKTPIALFMCSNMHSESHKLLQLLLRTGADPNALVSTWVWDKEKKDEQPDKERKNKQSDKEKRNKQSNKERKKKQKKEDDIQAVTIKSNEIPKGAKKIDVPLLHAALKNKWYVMVKNLLAFGANANAQHPSKGKTVLMSLVKRTDIAMLKEIVGSFASKFDPNVPDFKGVTPIAQAVQSQNLDVIFTLLSLSHAFKEPIDLGICDSEGKTPIIRAVCNNNINVLQLLLNAKTIVNPKEPNKYSITEPVNVKVNINAPGRNGWTAVHYVVNPLEDEFGSYENIEILELLVAKGADLNAKDNSKRTPLHYASVQDSGKLARALQRLGAAELPKGMHSRLQSSIFEWPDNGLDFNLDAQKVLDSIDESEAEAQEADPVVPVDPNAKDAGVVNWDEVKTKDGKKKVYYDVLLTIVDIGHGAYGINNFYKMQVLWDEVRDLHILWTRWGRIGDTGQFQRTPFPSAEEAKKEFKKIFKSKTGNTWEDKDNFERKPKKYKLITNEHAPQKSRYMKDILEPLSKHLQDPKTAKEAHMHTEITLVMQQFTNMSILNKAMVQAGFNMQLYKLTDGTLEEARKVLLTLKDVIQKLDASRKVQPPPGVDELLKNYETINNLSNQYYELIPHTNYSRSAIPPIDTIQAVTKKLGALESLVDVEVACKILMGAQYRMKEMHPLVYCFNSLEIKAEPLPKTGKEFDYLFKYFANTLNQQVRAVTRPLSALDNPALQKEPYNVEIVSILKIQRKGEAERIGKWKSLENHRLLWHGSGTSNFLGILSQGLRIAPPEAPVSGYAYGKGIYFADCAEKSYGYCRGTNDLFLLLSEVALGKMFTIDHTVHDAPRIGHDTIEAPLGFNSVLAPGGHGPDWDKSIVMPNGVSIPVEKPQNQNHPRRYGGYSEYIVYDVSQVRLRYLVHVRAK